MPTVTEQLEAWAWAILENAPGLVGTVPPAIFRVGNKIKQDARGWLRQAIATAPADFRQIAVTFGRFTYRRDALGFAGDDPDFHEQTGCDYDVIRSEELVITLRQELRGVPADSQIAREAVLLAFFQAGPRLGLPDLVLAVAEPQITGEVREARQGEKPFPGLITTIRIPVQTQQSGLAVMAESNPTE